MYKIYVKYKNFMYNGFVHKKSSDKGRAFGQSFHCHVSWYHVSSM